jgi:PII-like signaling protein
MATTQPTPPAAAGRRVRIYISERDRHGNQPLYTAIVEAARSAGLGGATAFKAILGYGAHSVMHADSVVDLSADLPVVIEIVDAPAAIDAFLPVLTGLMSDGLVTSEDVAIVYRGGEKPAQ